MKNKIVWVLLLAVTVVAGLLLWQNNRLKKKLDASAAIENQQIAPAIPSTKPANPQNVSPFDKPNVDPNASDFKPNATGPDKKTSIKFDKMSYDFGRIHEGDKVNTKFRFTNTGDWALVIAGAQGSCGCTVPQWPKEPIKPSDSDVIDVSFDSEGKHGEIKKTVRVVSNTEPAINELIITATVIPRER